MKLFSNYYSDIFLYLLVARWRKMFEKEVKVEKEHLGHFFYKDVALLQVFQLDNLLYLEPL